MATVIVLTNQKGGVGKTTTSSALAAGLALHNNRVLAVDMDPQGNLGFSLGLDIENSSNIYDVLTGKLPIQSTIQSTRYCDVITSNIMLSSAEMGFTGSGRESLLYTALKPIQDCYDYIVIDTPPALNILTVNAYTAASHLIIPMVPEILSLLGVSQLKETIASVKSAFNPNLNILGILLTRYNGRTLLAQEVKEMAEIIAGQISSIVFDTQIRTSVSVAEAPAQGESIFDYAPRCKPAEDYSCFVKEVIARIKRQEVS
ncbi:ParA family protein [Parasporobacterium paucivorans]|uniref:Sporulation initiation inhibitor protein Soj n=1 Tax=Parasporobacterium paucivorans DSM 15970 TaxID=1122934 RepID=A0A1M6GEV7_9FIRM|nr:ParA family protein [Parasporobacterium paucivorans]SHJ08458.1 chromosome partitioning protein [Parasporobacterium paucivorans DSM 15970]